jgi:hypothetical protein
MKKICIQCGEEFEISESEIEFYESRNLEIPKRCYKCRKSNRIRKNDAVVKRKKSMRGGFQFVFGNTSTGLMAILIIAVAIIFGGYFRGNNSGTNQNTNPAASGEAAAESTLVFRNWDLLNEHYEKHGKEMGYTSADAYLAAANAVVKNADALHKTEKEDGDDIYFVKATGDFVVVSTDGYIRTYFRPEDGVEYYNRQ